MKKETPHRDGHMFAYYILLIVVLTSCAVGQPLEENTSADEIPDGPGMFSGDSGEFILFEKKDDNSQTTTTRHKKNTKESTTDKEEDKKLN